MVAVAGMTAAAAMAADAPKGWWDSITETALSDRNAVASAAARRCLGESGTLTLGQIVARSGMPALPVARALRRMGARGQVEILRPLRGSREAVNRSAGRRPVFYRLVRDRDGEHAWQQRVTAPLPISRFRDWCRETELACGVW
jgi:hypothetical protein